jgi:DNA-binding transcriptional regulator YdaS (Cro superfamily)
METKPPIDRAIEAVGGQEAFLRLMGIKRRALFYWKKRGLPAERVPECSRMTGVPRHELRPDLWEAPAAQAVA